MAAVILLILLLTPQAPAPVGGSIEPPKKVRNVLPEYPDDARRAVLEGVVTLQCTIDTRGRVEQIEALDGPGPLRPAAIDAVKKWRYSPTLVDKKPIPVIMTVTVTFRHSGRVDLRELIDSLDHKDELIREAAAVALGRLGIQAQRAVPALASASNDPSERVRTAAKAALQKVMGQ